MYRARAAAVSGTKVFAGGKWLTCNGNKPVRVGDYVWTDGRCVYGNNQVPQQPLVITAPKDEGIPIAFANKKIYTFKKNKLTELGSFEIEDYNISKSTIFINDKKGKTFFNHDYNVLAGNIDSNGDIFRITYERYSWDFDLPVKFFIWKNGLIVNEIDLEPFRDATLADLQPSDESFHVAFKTNSKYYADMFWGFIENENDWAVTFRTSAVEVTSYDFWLEEHLPENNYWRNFCAQTLLFTRYHFLSSSQHLILFETVDQHLQHFNEDIVLINNEHENIEAVGVYRLGSDSRKNYDKGIENAKLPLQDDYYYRITETKTTDFFVYAPVSADDFSNFKNLQTLDITAFSPHDDKIFTVTCSLSSELRLKKIKGDSFLFAVSSNPGFTHEDNMADGLYLFKDGDFELLADGHVINQRMRSMKKIKGWQNRLKEF